MGSYIDIWTGFHLWLATLGFLLIEKWTGWHLMYVFGAVIAGALLWEIGEFAWEALKKKWGMKPSYATIKRHLINSWWDIVAAFVACGVLVIIM